MPQARTQFIELVCVKACNQAVVFVPRADGHMRKDIDRRVNDDVGSVLRDVFVAVADVRDDGSVLLERCIDALAQIVENDDGAFDGRVVRRDEGERPEVGDAAQRSVGLLEQEGEREGRAASHSLLDERVEDWFIHTERDAQSAR